MNGNLRTKEPCMGVEPKQWWDWYPTSIFNFRVSLGRKNQGPLEISDGHYRGFLVICTHLLMISKGTLIRHLTFHDFLVKRPIYFTSISNGKCALDPERLLGKEISHRRIPDTLPTLLLLFQTAVQSTYHSGQCGY